MWPANCIAQPEMWRVPKFDFRVYAAIVTAFSKGWNRKLLGHGHL